VVRKIIFSAFSARVFTKDVGAFKSFERRYTM